MKIRSDFVSNSSSSSFILKDAGFFAYFGITKQDINDAIADLCNMSNAASNSWCIYDMTNDDDRKKCFRKWDDHFSQWYAPNEGEYSLWSSIEETLHWKCNFDNILEVINGEADELEASEYSHANTKYITNKFPGGASFIKHIKHKLNIKTMKEVLHEKDCTLMIHFDDNEIYNVRGMSSYGLDDIDEDDPDDNRECEASGYESKAYTASRFFEILIKYFISKGKVDLADPKFLAYWLVRDDDTWYKREHPSNKYYLDNDVATWKDVYNEMLNCNAILHEG